MPACQANHFLLRDRQHWSQCSEQKSATWEPPRRPVYTLSVSECAALPHGVQNGAVLHDAEELVWRRHVVSDRLLAVSEEGVWRPNLGHHQVVEP